MSSKNGKCIIQMFIYQNPLLLVNNWLNHVDLWPLKVQLKAFGGSLGFPCVLGTIIGHVMRKFQPCHSYITELATLPQHVRLHEPKTKQQCAWWLELLSFLSLSDVYQATLITIYIRIATNQINRFGYILHLSVSCHPVC